MKINMELPEEFFKEEVRNDYLISSEMKKVWAVEMDLMKKTLEICKKYNIKVFADSGTLLGAIRHGGYIPWDDDIDLVLLRDDYNKFCEVAKNEFKEPYFFQTEFTDYGSGRGHIQIRNSDTTGILKSEENCHYKFNQGIFIDIFPLDFVPNDLKKRNEFQKKLSKKKNKYRRYMKVVFSKHEVYDLKTFIIRMIYYLLRPLKLDKKENIFYNDFENYVQKYNHKEECDYVALIAVRPNRENGFCKKEFYDEVIYKKFEMMEIPVPKEYEKVLDEMYGNWKELKKGTSVHGDIIFDTEKSYKEFVK